MQRPNPDGGRKKNVERSPRQLSPTMNSVTQAAASLGSAHPGLIQGHSSNVEAQRLDGLTKGGCAAAVAGGLEQRDACTGFVEEQITVKDVDGEVKDMTFYKLSTGDKQSNLKSLLSSGNAVIVRHVLSKKLSFDNTVSAIIKSKTVPSPKGTKEGSKNERLRIAGSPDSQAAKSSATAGRRKSRNPPKGELGAMKLKYDKLREQHRRKIHENNQLKNEVCEKDQKLEIVNRHLASARKNNCEQKRQLHNFNHELQVIADMTDSQKHKVQVKSFQKSVVCALEKNKDQDALFGNCNEELASAKKNPSQDMEIAALKRNDKRQRGRIAKLIASSNEKDERIRSLEQGLAAAQAFPVIGLTSRVSVGAFVSSAPNI
jgi:hypothetical protein